MDWIQAAIATTSEGIEVVTGRLYMLGINGVEIEDEKDFNDFLENNKQYWDYVDEELRKKMAGETKVKVYLSNNASGHEMLAAVRETLADLKRIDAEGLFGRLEITLENMSEEDWADNWKQYFKPLKIGERLLIKPEWEKLPDDYDGRTVFTVNPGMTFGTGTHQSTQLCIELIEQYVKQGSEVLDLGCGSGILSIICLLLGASHAAAVDIDPNAVPVAYSNARLNDIKEGSYEVMAGNIITDDELADKLGYKKYDLVLANIVADVIIAAKGRIKQQLKPDGIFIASGIIEERLDEVVAELEAHGFNVFTTTRKDGWTALAAKLK